LLAPGAGLLAGGPLLAALKGAIAAGAAGAEDVQARTKKEVIEDAESL
jgi:hypothetical protein